MSLETPINHSCNIKCPKCAHNFLYEFKIEDLEKVSSTQKSQETETNYKFKTYLICKNPLCNYDIEIIGKVLECPTNKFSTINLSYIK